ncbi:hypothetical protein [Flavivirga jejuensis]|uniref:Peptidase M23-like protein n=1 Tax=Flavivirga jejuensis TaxID=870487 RepID=A0ABT8WJU0_9FLAO|nr:hypothetical protein [Flavivirga jejuensis]MDO5973427.1 hypothetical protein [Flavivirga jejuensis]
MKKKTKSGLLILFFFIGFSNNILSQEKTIKIKTERNKDKSVDFYYKKNLPGSFHLTIKFTTLENTKAYTYREVVKSNYGFLFKLKPKNANESIKYSYRTSYIRGIPNPKIDSLFTYTLPFKKGKHVIIHENNNVGEKYFNDEKPKNWKSYGIKRKQADTVTNMRKGIVVKITNKFDTDTLVKKKFTTQINRILIEHADGTFASYKGFKKDAIFVKLGQKVYPQTELGILDIFNESYRLYFNIYYLKTDSLNSKEKSTLTKRKRNYAYITPYYYTEKGAVQLENKNKYKIVFDDEAFLKEFSKKEFKKYKKTPEHFE